MRFKKIINCSNSECSNFGQEILDYTDVRCSVCGDILNFSYQINGETFNDFSTAAIYTCGLAKQGELLKRLIDAGIATEEDKENFSNIFLTLEQAGCGKCKQLQGVRSNDEKY